MIQCGLLQQIDESASRAALGIAASEDHPLDSAVNDCSSAHWAGFFGHIEVTVSEPPVASGLLGLGQGKHLSVGGGVFERLNLIVRAGYDAPFGHDDSSNGHLTIEVGLLSLPHGLAHEERVAGQVDDRDVFRNGAWAGCGGIGIVGSLLKFTDHFEDVWTKVLRLWESVKIMR